MCLDHFEPAGSERFELPDLGFEVSRCAKIYPLKQWVTGCFWLRIWAGRSGDLSLVLELKFQFFNHLNQALCRERVRRLQRAPTDLRQLQFQCLSGRACHPSAPFTWTVGSLKCSKTPSHFVNFALFDWIEN